MMLALLLHGGEWQVIVFVILVVVGIGAVTAIAAYYVVSALISAFTNRSTKETR